ncbi:MAG: SDR family NAD(P)-dependent oxidoreductase [Pseudomonadota bacterium]
MRMDGKTVLVTGAASGIGKACAAYFAEEGAKVAIVDWNAETGQAAEAEIGRGAKFYQCDVGLSDQAKATVAEVLADFGKIDVLVANAGLTRRGEFLDIEEEDWDEVLRVNLKHVYLFGRLVGQHMKERGEGGSIINMSSTSVQCTMGTISPYAASKGGISSLTNAMALSLAKYGIRVNAIGPGTIVTEINRDNLLANKDNRRAILSRTPMLRFGEAREVAGVAMFLASPDSSYVTGQTIYVEGGRLGLNYTVPVPDDALED